MTPTPATDLRPTTSLTAAARALTSLLGRVHDQIALAPGEDDGAFSARLRQEVARAKEVLPRLRRGAGPLPVQIQISSSLLEFEILLEFTLTLEAGAVVFPTAASERCLEKAAELIALAALLGPEGEILVSGHIKVGNTYINRELLRG